jgi:integrase
VTVTLGGVHKQTAGWGAPQMMRMLLLQILTGRRLSEICLTEFNCLSVATGGAAEVAEGQIARFCYGQSKIDQAPDTILVDAEVVAVIEEQQQWVREQLPGPAPRYLFPRRNANACGTKPYARQSYIRLLQHFSQSAQITDSAGKPVHLNHTHRFRHTKLTRLAELGMPVHVLQRYAGHATPTMSMHYVAQRENTPSRRSWPPASSKPTAPRWRSPARTTMGCTCSTGRTASYPTATAYYRPYKAATKVTPA